MKKWIVLCLLAIGMLLVLAGCGGCSLTSGGQTPAPASQQSGQSPAPGACIATNTDGAETVAIKGATFKMGSQAADAGAAKDEQPQHKVKLDCYNIYTKEVTNAMYNKCVAAGACLPVQARANTPTAHINDPAFVDYPVVGVDYNMATEYCTWAGARLPTEAEWEYAARGSKILPYPWGTKVPDCSLANGKSCLTPEDTEKVALLAAGKSPFGLFDMAGNAWEWVFDWYDASYYGVSASTNPTGPNNGYFKVARSGGYNSIADLLRSANRHAGNPYRPYHNVGFRCVTAPITLSADYVPPNPYLHQVPNGPIDDDDPDHPLHDHPMYSVLAPGCPDGGGNLHFDVLILPHSEATLASFSVDGGPNYSCTWDDVAHRYHCIGPDSPGVNPLYQTQLCIHWAGNPDICNPGILVPRSLDCDGTQTPDKQSLSVSCPKGDLILAKFFFEPAVLWDTAQIDGGMDMTCEYITSKEYDCTAPNVPIGGPYTFHLHGTGAVDPLDYTWDPTAFTPNDCPGEFDFKLDPYCNKDGALQIDEAYQPTDQGVPILELASNPVSMSEVTPGQSTGTPDQGLMGTTVGFKTYLAGHPGDAEVGAIDLPDCSPDAKTFALMWSTCYEEVPILDTVFGPPDEPVVLFQVDGVDVPWVPEDPSTPEHMHYPLPPSLWGLTFDAKICLGNLSTCFVFELDAPADCTPSSGKSGFTHMMFCDQGNIPTACITYWPQVPQVLSIDVNGAPVPCVKIGDLPPNDTNIHCALDQSLQGTNVTASVCPGGVCQDAMVDVPVCGQQQTPDCICRVTAPDCLTTTAMGFNVDTCVKNPVALVPGSVTANDGTNSYDCVVTGGVGSAYCGGSIPSSSGPLTVCFTQEGSSDQKCCYFENFGNSIPNCSSYNPNPGGPQVNCSLFSTQASCQSNGCTWIPGTVKPGYCQ